jgi:hypothetical protein
MTNLIQAIDRWWSVHPHLVELLLTFVALFAGIFPERSRRVVLAPVSHSLLGVLRFIQGDAKNQLEIVRRLNGDSFRLVAYIAFYSLHAIFWSFWVAVICWFGANLVEFLLVGHGASVPFSSLFVPALFGRAIKLYYLVGGLFHVEEYTASLEKIVSDKLPSI